MCKSYKWKYYNFKYEMGFMKKIVKKSAIYLLIFFGLSCTQTYASTEVTEAEVRREYQDMIAHTAHGKQYKTRIFLVEKEEEAKQIIEQLQKGSSFEVLAKQYAQAKLTDLSLEWSFMESYLEPLAEALAGLEKGSFNLTPIKSSFGYHVIQLVDVRVSKAPDYEQVKDELREKIRTSKQEIKAHEKLLKEQAVAAEKQRHDDEVYRRHEAAQRMQAVEKVNERLNAFRRSIRVETETNCGPVLEIRGALIKIYSPIRNYGNEHWIRKEQIFPPSYDCHFFNGNYTPPMP